MDDKPFFNPGDQSVFGPKTGDDLFEPSRRINLTYLVLLVLCLPLGIACIYYGIWIMGIPLLLGALGFGGWIVKGELDRFCTLRRMRKRASKTDGNA